MFTRDILSELLDENGMLIADTFEEYCERSIEGYRTSWERDRKFPTGIMKDISGMFGNTISSDVPDERMDEAALGAVSEIMGKYGFPIPAFLTLHFSKLLRYLPDGTVKKNYLNRMRSGDLIICGAFSEPGCGSDSAAIRTTADKSDGSLLLNGEKSFVSSPGIANTFIVSARTSSQDEKRPYRGISLIVADRETDGIGPYAIRNMASEFDGDFGGVVFANAQVPGENILGKMDDGFSILMNAFNFQRVHVALYALGLAERSIEEAVEYSKIRKTFGNPISKYQAVSFRLAEDWTRIESSRLLAYHALKMPENSADTSSYCAGVKWYACENAFRAVDDSLQTLGASGYVITSEMEKRFRAARGFLIGDGTPDIQKLIIARNMFGRGYSP